MNTATTRTPGRASLWAGLTLAATVTAFVGTSLASRPASGRYDGPPVPLGQGTARSYVILEQGKPVEIGVALSETALEGLPEAAFNPTHQGHHMMQEYLLKLPKEAGKTPFQLVEVDWNPAGHMPPGIYDLPHFDFHFYTIDLAARNRIVRESPTFIEQAERIPEAPFIPAGYISPSLDMVEPRMGRHWVNQASPELNGQTFTHTFVYGTWDGRLIFGEPMLTKAFLASKPNLTVPVPMAESYSPAGPYPSAYGVHFDAGRREYRVSLRNLVERGGADAAF